MTTYKPIVISLVVVAVLMLFDAFAIGRRYGRIEGRRVPSWAVHLDVLRDTRWIVIAIPPCSQHQLSTEAVGLTYAQAWRNASDLAQLEGMENVRGRPMRNGVLVCP